MLHTQTIFTNYWDGNLDSNDPQSPASGGVMAVSCAWRDRLGGFFPLSLSYNINDWHFQLQRLFTCSQSSCSVGSLDHKCKKLNTNLSPQSICTNGELINLHLIMGVTRIHSSFHVRIFTRWVPHLRYDGKRCPFVRQFVRVKSHLSVRILTYSILSLWAFHFFMEWKDLAKRDPSFFLFFFYIFPF